MTVYYNGPGTATIPGGPTNPVSTEPELTLRTTTTTATEVSTGNFSSGTTARRWHGLNVGTGGPATGTSTVEVNVTTASTDVQISVRLLRVNSGGTIQSASTATAEQTGSAGVKTFNVASWAPGTWASGDWLVVETIFRSTAAHGNSSIGVTYGNTNSEVTVPNPPVSYTRTVTDGIGITDTTARTRSSQRYGATNASRTIGYAEAGSLLQVGSDTTVVNSSNDAVLRFTAANGDRITTVWVYGQSTGSTVAEVGLYTVSGGLPNTRVATASVTLSTTLQWYSTAVDWQLDAGVEYVLAIDLKVSGNGSDVAYDATGSTSIDNITSLPATWSQDTTIGRTYSVYGDIVSGDPVGITDTVVVTKSIAVTVTDPIGVTDAVVAVETPDGDETVADDIDILDQLIRVAAFARGPPADPVGITDTADVAKSISVSIVDPIGLTDDAVRTHAAVREFTDPVGVTDTALPSVGHQRTIGEGGGTWSPSFVGVTTFYDLTGTATSVFPQHTDASPTVTEDAEGLTDGTDLDASSDWDVHSYAGTGVMQVDTHTDHKSGQVIDMSEATGEQIAVHQTALGSDDHWVEGTVFLDAPTTGLNRVGVLFRGQSATADGSWDGYLGAVEKNSAGQVFCRLYDVTNGVLTQLATSFDVAGTGFGDIDTSVTNVIRVEVRQTYIKVFVDGYQYIGREILTTDTNQYLTGVYTGTYLNRGEVAAASAPFWDDLQAGGFVGATAGNLLVGGLSGDKALGTITDPPGSRWTRLEANSGASHSIGLWWRIATGDADDEFDPSWATTHQVDTHLAEYTAAGFSISTDGSDFAYTDTAATGVTVDLGSATSDGLLVGFAGIDSDPVGSDLDLSTGGVALTERFNEIGKHDSGAGQSVGSFGDAFVSASGSRSVTTVWSSADQNSLALAQFVATGGGSSELVGITDTVVDSLTQDQDSAEITDPIGITDTAFASKAASATITDPVGVTDALVVSKSISVAVVDSIGITDDSAFVLDKTRTDPVGITDTAERALDIQRSLTDSVGLLDTTEFIDDDSATESDNIGITDATVRALDIQRAVVDSVGVTDDPIVLLDTAIVDPLGITDTAVAAKSISVILVDGVGLTDAAVVEKAAAESVIDSIGITDATALTRSSERPVTDPVGITDATATAKSISVSIVDPIGLTDDAVRTHAAVREFTDPVGITDTVISAFEGEESEILVNTIGLTDTAATAKSVPATAADDVGIVDSAIATKAVSVEVVESVGLSDAATRSVGAARILADTVNITDTATDDLVGQDTSVVTDAIGIADTAERVASTTRAATDDVGITDTVDGNKSIPVLAADVVGLSDVLAVAKSIAVVVSDAVGITDTVDTDLSGADSPTIVDPVGITDVVVRTALYERSATDSIGVTDTAESTKTVAIEIVDGIGATDTVDPDKAVAASITEAIGITDSVVEALEGDDSTTPVDPVGITDTVERVHDAVRVPVDPVGITDIDFRSLDGDSGGVEVDSDVPRRLFRSDEERVVNRADVARRLFRADVEREAERT